MMIQQEHVNILDNIIEPIDISNNNEHNIDFNVNEYDVNEYIVNKGTNKTQVKQMKITDMDKFIKRTRHKKNQIPNIIIPKQKEVNIKTTDLRYKIDIPTVIDDMHAIDMIFPQNCFFIDE